MLLLTLSHCYADPTTLAKSRKDEEGDLVTAVKQKLLKRILSQVTPKRELVTTPRRAPKREPVTPPQTLPIKIPKKQPAIVPENVPWSELPFAEEGPEPDLEAAVKKTLRKMRKTPRYLKQLRPAKGWTSWDPSGKKKKKKSESSIWGSVVKPLGSIAKRLAFDDDGGGRSSKT